MKFAWTDEARAKAKDLWQEGYSARQIMTMVGNGVTQPTRNGVLGIVFRAGLTGAGGNRPGSAQRRPKSRPAAMIAKGAPRPAAFKPEPFMAQEEVAVPVGERKRLVDLEAGDCRWPIGDPRQDDFHFCNGKAVPGLSYCEHHVRRAYQPESSQPRRAPAHGATPARTREREVEHA